MTHLGVNSLTDPMKYTGYPSPPEDFRYDRVVPPLPQRPDPVDAQPYYWTRHRPEPGETMVADETWPEKPLTLDFNARSLPYQNNQQPNLPIRDFWRQFPHTWIPYDQMYAAVYPDEPPMPSGYAPAPYAHNEEARAIDEAMPHPWSSEENMTHDISGFGYLGQGGMLAYAAAVDATKKEADDAKAAGASDSTLKDIVNFGAQVGALYLQKRQLDGMQAEAERQRASQLEIERLKLQQQQLAVQAARAGAGNQVVNDMSPPGPGISPWLVGGGVAVATVAATQLI